MTDVYTYPVDRKPHVHKATFYGAPAWEAGKPGGYYLFGEGLHFTKWADAIAYALSPVAVTPERDGSVS